MEWSRSPPPFIAWLFPGSALSWFAPAFADGDRDAFELSALEEYLPPNSHVSLPLWYFTRLLDAHRSEFDAVHIVTEPISRNSALIRALVARYNATVQAGDAVMDYATLLHASQLVTSAGTFSYTAATMGCAKRVHSPHVGPLSLFATTLVCLFAPGGNTSKITSARAASMASTLGVGRFLYHDVHWVQARSRLRHHSSVCAARFPAVSALLADEDHCLGYHTDDPKGSTLSQLVAFYRDERCRRLVWAFVTPRPEGLTPGLCIDELDNLPDASEVIMGA